MALFGISTKSQNLLDREVVEKFIDDTAERLKSPNPYKNPLKGKIRKYVLKEVYVVKIEPLYFNFTLYFWPMVVIGFLFVGFSPWLLIPIGFGCCGVFWTKRFFYFLLVKGLRKAGYVGPVVMLSNKQIVERLLF